MISDKSNPLASIIINNYNYGRFLGEAIDSALNQGYPHIEVIVVDDGSTDNSQEVVESYGNRIISVLKENGGQASAFNAGFAASRGEVIFLLDSDDTFLPKKVADVVDVFTEYPDTGWCFHSLRLVDENNNMLLEGRHEAGPSRRCDFRMEVREKGKMHFNHPATSGLCFKRSLLQQMLPMPEAESISIGDHYLKFTASALSEGFYLDEELVLQKVHSCNAYTSSNNKYKFKSKIFILTAYWMHVKFPMLTKFTNKLFAVGLGIYWRTGGIDKKYREVVRTYLSSISLTERLEINLRAFYHSLKLIIVQN